MPEDAHLASDKNNLAFSLGKPNHLFLLLGNYLFHKKLIKCTPIHFANARVEAESTAWDKSSIKEVNLIQIYKELAYILHLNQEVTEELMVLEITLQWILLKNISDDLVRKFLPIPPNKNQKKPVHRIYGNFNLNIQPGKDCTQSFLSWFDAEYTAQKKYFDNDKLTDLKYTEVQLLSLPYSRYENILNDFVWETGGLSSAMAGASNLERLYMQAADAEKKLIIDVAAGLIAPTLVSYVLWIINRANSLKIKRLYFFKGDGFLLYSIAEILKKKLQIDLNLLLVSDNKSLVEVIEPDKVALISTFTDIHQPDIENFLNHQKIKNPMVFYFYLNKNKKDGTQSEGYIWDGSKKIGYKNLLNNLQDIVKPFFLPSKINDLNGNKDKSDALSGPEIFKHPKDEKSIIFNSILGFTESLFLHKPFINPYNDMRPAIANLIKTFGRNPTSTEVKIWKKLIQNLSSDNSMKKIARPYQLTDLYFIFKNGDLHHNKYWAEGSLALTPSPFDSIIKLSSKIGTRINKLRKNF
ncbi:hypothetical protein BH23BAC1_BH23BAC1_20270 [soil metagenome]